MHPRVVFNCWIVCTVIFLLAAASQAEVKVSVEHRATGPAFQFNTVPLPANNDAATTAEFILLEGTRDRNGGELSVLHDGRVPAEEDEPSSNFFFRAGTAGGRLRLDLGAALSVKQVNTYSWHSNTRAAQVYILYAADGQTNTFEAAPKQGTDPQSCGWQRLARVDTRGSVEGGQHGAMVLNPVSPVLGTYRYLLFDIVPTEEHDAFGNTFFSEIDVIDANGPPPTNSLVAESQPVLRTFTTADGRYQFTLDATAAPDLLDWAETELRPVVQTWYPKLVTLLPSEGFVAATNLTLRFRTNMAGTPASAGGGHINMNAGWFRRELKREARGSVVHEMVHVVQNYGRARRTNPNATRTPGWVTEGIADYIRWFLYEPESKGAEITVRNLERARYDASYRVTGNFLNWVTQKYDGELVRKLNAAARQGRYGEALWKEWTGRTLVELGDEWKAAHTARLQAARLK